MESQNHRTVGVGRDLCGSSSPTLLPKQGHLQQAAQDLVHQDPQVPFHRAAPQPGKSQPVLDSWIMFSQVQDLTL